MRKPLSASSRLIPNVVWVRSLVPNEKNSAYSAISSAVRAARGISIIVPNLYAISRPCSSMTALASASSTSRWRLSSFTWLVSGIITSGMHVDAFPGHLAGRLEDGPHLHAGQLRHENAEAHAAGAEHRVGLAQRLDPVEHDRFLGHLGQQLVDLVEVGGVAQADLEVGQVVGQLVVAGEELVERRVDQPDDDRQPVHRPEQAGEVLPLERQQRVDGLPAFAGRLGRDHPLHDRQPLLLEEHVLGAAQADALGAVLAGALGVARIVGVGPARRGSGTRRPTRAAS